MLLFGKVSGNLPDREKDHPESNEDSIPLYLSDSQHHSDTIYRRDREGPQGPQSHLLAEKSCRSNALLPGVEDRVAQFDLRRRAGERRALAFDGRDAAHAQHALERERPQTVRQDEGPLLEDLQLPGRHCAEVRQGTAQGLLLPHQGPGLYGTAGPVETPAARPKRLYFQAVLEFGSGAMGR